MTPSCYDHSCKFRERKGGLCTNGGCHCADCPSCGGRYLSLSLGVRHHAWCDIPAWTPRMYFEEGLRLSDADELETLIRSTR